MCAYCMQSKDRHGVGFAMKLARFLTNPIATAKAPSRRCPGNHRHVHLVEGRARAAAIYPQVLLRAICRATLEQAKADAGDMMCVQCVESEDDDLSERGGIRGTPMEVLLRWPHGETAQKGFGGGSPSGGAVGGEEDASLAEGETRGVFPGNGPSSHQARVGRHL